MAEESIAVRKEPAEKSTYQQPKLTVLGDVAEITLGNDLGDELDAVFTTNGASTTTGRKKKKDRFS